MQMGHARRYALAMMNLCPVEGLGSVSRKGKKTKRLKRKALYKRCHCHLDTNRKTKGTKMDIRTRFSLPDEWMEIA